MSPIHCLRTIHERRPWSSSKSIQHKIPPRWQTAPAATEDKAPQECDLSAAAVARRHRRCSARSRTPPSCFMPVAGNAVNSPRPLAADSFAAASPKHRYKGSFTRLRFSRLVHPAPAIRFVLAPTHSGGGDMISLRCGRPIYLQVFRSMPAVSRRPDLLGLAIVRSGWPNSGDEFDAVAGLGRSPGRGGRCSEYATPFFTTAKPTWHSCRPTAM